MHALFQGFLPGYEGQSDLHSLLCVPLASSRLGRFVWLCVVRSALA